MEPVTMTNQQGMPEALRLADALECRTTSWPDKVFAAAELRRLHAENVRLAALVEAQQPAPSAAAAGQRRSDLVPGVMHCAKCKFQLNRVTLVVGITICSLTPCMIKLTS